MTDLRERTLLQRPRWLTDDVLRGVRWGAIVVWAVVFAGWMYENGIPFWRTDLLLWLTPGLLAASIGKRNVFTVIIDFLPLALVLIVYDHLRAISQSLGMPTWWHPQIDIDKFLFLGNVPTVWLQEHLRAAQPRWYDALVTLCYISFFFLPYVTAAILWIRSRRDFYKWTLRFVVLSFVAFGFFALIPSAPPWAAARCSAADVADHPYNPPCLGQSSRFDGGLLGVIEHPLAGTDPWVTQGGSTRGFGLLHIHFAQQIIDEGRNIADAVAAIPSLHVGGIVLFSLFMWRRVPSWLRPFLIAYPFFMMFSLAYGAEHYVTDGIAGALCAWAVHAVFNRIEARRKREAPVDTLAWCPPSPAPETTPSSTSANDGDSSSHPARSTAAPVPHGTTDHSASS